MNGAYAAEDARQYVHVVRCYTGAETSRSDVDSRSRGRRVVQHERAEVL